MHSITQFASVTFKTNAPSAKLSKKVDVRVRAAASMPAPGSMDSNDENDVVTTRDASSFVPQAPPVQKDNAIFS